MPSRERFHTSATTRKGELVGMVVSCGKGGAGADGLPPRLGRLVDHLPAADGRVAGSFGVDHGQVEGGVFEAVAGAVEGGLDGGV